MLLKLQREGFLGGGDFFFALYYHFKKKINHIHLILCLLVKQIYEIVMGLLNEYEKDTACAYWIKEG